MTRERAKELLELYRANDADRSDPFFSEALQMLEVDPVLADWFENEREFDGTVSRAVADVPIPADLKSRLLLHQVTPTRPRWWHHALRPAEFGLAAAIAFLLAIGIAWLYVRPPVPSPFRAEVLQQTWLGRRHVDLETSNLPEIRRFIAAHDLRGDFKLPPELAAMRPHGCSLLSVKGRRVPYVCFIEGSKHLHLVVMDRTLFPDPVEMGTPDFETWQNWNTATWTQGKLTFVLTGLKPNEFVKKFRKDGQWTWGG